MLCSLQTIPGTGGGRCQLRGRETILERAPGLTRPPAPSPGGSRCHVQTRHVCQINAAEPGGDGAIQGASQGMQEGWDASSDGACCYRHRLQLRQLPWPTKICSLCRRIRPLSLLAFPLFQSLLPCVDRAGARPSGRGGHGSEGHREWEEKLRLLFAHHHAPQRQPSAQGSPAAGQPSCPGWAVAAASCPGYPLGDCSQRRCAPPAPSRGVTLRRGTRVSVTKGQSRGPVGPHGPRTGRRSRDGLSAGTWECPHSPGQQRPCMLPSADPRGWSSAVPGPWTGSTGGTVPLYPRGLAELPVLCRGVPGAAPSMRTGLDAPSRRAGPGVTLGCVCPPSAVALAGARDGLLGGERAAFRAARGCLLCASSAL